MQEQESKQELTHYYKTIFTLKSGRQIEICTKKLPADCIEYEWINGSRRLTIHQDDGFIMNPLLVQKSLIIKTKEIAATETIKDPCIAQVVPWPEDVQGGDYKRDPFVPNKHSDKCNCQECYYKRSNLEGFPNSHNYPDKTGIIDKTIAEMKIAAFEKYKTKDNKLKDFLPIGTQVKVITPCSDRYFFYGETGKVIMIDKIKIEVEFDIPRKFEDGTEQKSFYFIPQDLITIYDFERLNKPIDIRTINCDHPAEMTCAECQPNKQNKVPIDPPRPKEGIKEFA